MENNVKIHCHSFGSRWKSNFRDSKHKTYTISLNRHEPLSDVKIGLILALCPTWTQSKLDMTFISSKTPFFFVFDRMMVEDDATPMGLGMVDGDSLGFGSNFWLQNVRNHAEVISCFEKTRRRATEISVGLNVLVGEEEGGMRLFGHGNQCSQCHQVLNTIHTILLPKLLIHCSDMDQIKNKLESNGYIHVHEVKFDILKVIYKIDKNHSELEQVDIKMVKVAEEFFEVNQVAECRNYLFDTTFYVGPVRNSTPSNYLSSWPIVQLSGVSMATTVEELLLTWVRYAGNHVRELPNYLTLGNLQLPVKADKGVLEQRLVDVISTYNDGTLGQYIYLALPLAFSNMLGEDERDIDQLMEFIEGGKEKQGIKKKRRKNKKGGTAATLHVEAKLMEGEARNNPDSKSSSNFQADSQYSENQPQPQLVEERLSNLNLNTRTLVPAPMATQEMKAFNIFSEIGCKEFSSLIPEAVMSEEFLSEGFFKGKCREKWRGLGQEEKEAFYKMVKTEEPAGIPAQKFGVTQDEKIQIKEDSKQECVNTKIVEKLAMLNEEKEFAMNIIESKSKEMTTLIAGLQDAEDHKSNKLKEIDGIEARIRELQANKAILDHDCEQIDDSIVKIIKKKRKLEEFISTKLSENKIKIATLEEEIETLKLEASNIDKEQKLDTTKSAKQPNLELLEYINSKIEAKEEELECPVCLEVAEAPIFMCDDLHLLCSTCRPKVRID